MSVTIYMSAYTVRALPYFIDLRSLLRLWVEVCVHVCVLAMQPTNDNAIMRSYQYSSHRPEQGGVLIKMILGHPRLSTFTQIHTQVL